MNAILQNIMNRRSIRKFTEQPVAKADLEQLLQAASYAPSGNNRQSWQFTAVVRQDSIRALAAAMGKALGNQSYNLYCPTALILVSNDPENTNGLADCACAMENIMLMASALNLGSCWINQLKQLSNEPEVREILNRFGVPAHHTVWAMAAVGYPAETKAAAPRKENVIHYAD